MLERKQPAVCDGREGEDTLWIDEQRRECTADEPSMETAARHRMRGVVREEGGGHRRIVAIVMPEVAVESGRE